MSVSLVAAALGAQADDAATRERARLASARGTPDEPVAELELAQRLVERARELSEASGPPDAARFQGVPLPALDAPQAIAMRAEAAGLLRAILFDHRSFEQGDRVLLELVQLLQIQRDYRSVAPLLQQLGQRFPTSALATQAMIIECDIAFDEADLRRARRCYEAIAQRPNCAVTAVAHYKLAWVATNHARTRDDWNSVLAHFKRAILASDRTTEQGRQLRSEAILDSSWAFVQAGRKMETAEAYFRQFDPGEEVLVKVLEKLAMRALVRQYNADALLLFRRLLELSQDEGRRQEWRERVQDLTEEEERRRSRAKRGIAIPE